MTVTAHVIGAWSALEKALEPLVTRGGAAALPKQFSICRTDRSYRAYICAYAREPISYTANYIFPTGDRAPLALLRRRQTAGVVVTTQH